MVFSEFRSRRNGSLPQTKVSSSVGGVSSSCGSVPGRRLRTDGAFFPSAIDKQVKKKPLPKVAPLVSVLQEEALLLLLLLRTYSYIQSVLPLPGTQRASCHPSSPTIPNGILLTRALRQRSGLRACEDD
ncbi:hypothetical protein V8C43DRAFT_106070 [Trichoderma afarasin]